MPIKKNVSDFGEMISTWMYQKFIFSCLGREAGTGWVPVWEAGVWLCSYRNSALPPPSGPQHTGPTKPGAEWVVRPHYLHVPLNCGLCYIFQKPQVLILRNVRALSWTWLWDRCHIGSAQIFLRQTFVGVVINKVTWTNVVVDKKNGIRIMFFIWCSRTTIYQQMLMFIVSD